MKLISYGGGVQSTCMVLMALKGAFERPDVVVFADTGSEMPSTYSTVDQVEQLCVDDGLEFVRVQHGILYEDYIKQGILPRIGNSSCTGNYKINPIRRYLRANQCEDGPKPWSEVWIGITTDESRRMRESDVKWVKNRFPLIEANMSRDDCQTWINENYIGINPEKSGCFHCHFNKANHWGKLKRDHPELFAIALEMEESANKGQYEFRNGLYRNKTIKIFDYSHQLTDFGVEIYPGDVDCSTAGGCFV